MCVSVWGGGGGRWGEVEGYISTCSVTVSCMVMPSYEGHPEITTPFK